MQATLAYYSSHTHYSLLCLQPFFVFHNPTRSVKRTFLKLNVLVLAFLINLLQPFVYEHSQTCLSLTFVFGGLFERCSIYLLMCIYVYLCLYEPSFYMISYLTHASNILAYRKFSSFNGLMLRPSVFNLKCQDLFTICRDILFKFSFNH